MTLTARLGSPFTEHEITLKCLLSSRILRFVSSDHGMYEPGYCSNIIEQLDSIPQRVNNHMIVLSPSNRPCYCLHAYAITHPLSSYPVRNWSRWISPFSCLSYFPGLCATFQSSLFATCIGHTKAFGQNAKAYIGLTGVFIGMGEICGTFYAHIWLCSVRVFSLGLQNCSFFCRPICHFTGSFWPVFSLVVGVSHSLPDNNSPICAFK